MNAKQKKAGRPRAITPEQLRQIEECTVWGWPIGKSCDYAGVRPTTFFDYQREHPDFRRKLSILRDFPVLAAKRAVAEAVLAGDLEMSRWYLERRLPSEFGRRRRVDVGEDQGVDDDLRLRRALARLVAASR